MKIAKTYKVNGTDVKVDKLIKEYYDTIKPDMDLNTFQKICKTPFRHIRSRIGDDNLYEVRYNHLGRFTVKPRDLVWMLHNDKKRYDKGLITQATYNRNVAALTDYVSKNPKTFERFKEKLKPFIEI